jgi:hypothetical protein
MVPADACTEQCAWDVRLVLAAGELPGDEHTTETSEKDRAFPTWEGPDITKRQKLLRGRSSKIR